MFNKGIQVKVKETMEDGTIQTWGGILIDDNTLIAADNGAIFSLDMAPHIKIVERLSWIPISDEILGDYCEE